jgi:hypothetical protein
MHPDCQSDCMYATEGERLGRPLTTSTENVMRQHTYDGNSGVVVGAMWGEREVHGNVCGWWVAGVVSVCVRLLREFAHIQVFQTASPTQTQTDQFFPTADPTCTERVSGECRVHRGPATTDTPVHACVGTKQLTVHEVKERNGESVCSSTVKKPTPPRSQHSPTPRLCRSCRVVRERPRSPPSLPQAGSTATLAPRARALTVRQFAY